MNFKSYLLAHRPTPRRGVVLLVVMVMLALFAALALAFVFYAESQANLMNLAMQTENNSSAEKTHQSGLPQTRQHRCLLTRRKPVTVNDDGIRSFSFTVPAARLRFSDELATGCRRWETAHIP